MHPQRKLTGLIAAFSLPLLILGCGQNTSTDPYANGQKYPWAFQASGPAAQSLTPGVNTLQYEPVRSASNAWGPIEKNASNGSQAGGDGQPLTLGGKTYAQGFGTHAGSELVFSLLSNDVNCTRFTADIGIDDEVGERGSAVFQVLLGGTVAYTSPTLTGASDTQSIDIDITGKKELRLVVSDSGDGIAYDHADWADPKLMCATKPTTPVTPVTPVIPVTPTRHFDYVAVDQALKVYDIDDGYKLVKTIALPGMGSPRGIAANAETDRLYLPYFGDRNDPKYKGQPTFGYVLALDLKTDKVIWTRKYSPSIDSMAITPDGKKLYMGAGEDAGGDFWFVLDGLSGDEITRIPVYKNAHNTIVGASGKKVYMASVSLNYLTVADTATDKVSLEVGPFARPVKDSGLRPFTVNGAETLAFVNPDHFSGFEIGDLKTGKMLYSVPVKGFPWKDETPSVQSHGVSLSPDEKEAWVVDAYNRKVHIFDISGLPAAAPVQVADIDVIDPADPKNLPKWINFTRDGRFVHVSTGAIIDTVTHKIVHKIDNTRYFAQIDFQGNEPVAAYSRYGLGYANQPTPASLP